jgi:hypothetical protein
VLVAGKTHDLLNLVQIVKLATAELGKHCAPSGQEFIDDLTRAAVDAEASLRELMGVARPDRKPARGPTVGGVITRAVEELRESIPIDLHLAISPETATALSAEELTHLVFGIALDAADAPRIELFVRERRIANAPWVEIVRGADVPANEGEPSFDLGSVERVIARADGEMSCSERRGGGSELVVALPAL